MNRAMRRVVMQSSSMSSSVVRGGAGVMRAASRARFGGRLGPGEVAEHRIGGRAGQLLVLRLPAEGAAFTLHDPATGAAMPGAGPGDGARRWEGRLPAEGEVLVRIRATLPGHYLLEAEIG